MLFGSQSCISKTTSSAELRYPKRKRTQVAYHEIDGDEFLLGEEDKEDKEEEDEEEYGPTKKKPKKSRSAKPLHKHQIFPFMRLPPELRNRIYKFALSDQDDIYITSITKRYRRIAKRCTKPDCLPQFQRNSYGRYGMASEEEDSPPPTPSEFSPNLLAVSKTIYAEAISFLYGQRITLADNYALLSFLNQIGPQHTSLLQEIRIKDWCSGRAHRSINFPAMILLASATDLKLLDIDCALGYFSSYYYGGRKKQAIPSRVARKAYRDCYPLFEAIGKARGNHDAAVEMIRIHECNFGRGYDVNDPEMEVNVEGFRQELRRLLKT